MNNKNFQIDNSGIDPQTNFSANPEFQQILASRRSFLKGSLGAAIATIMGTTLAGCDTDSADPVKLPEAQLPEPAPVLLGFTALAAARPDTILVPQGYTARAFLPMGTPLLGSYPAYKNGGQNTGAEAEQQAVAAREALREQVAALAVKGAEQILRKEVNAGVHADLLNRLKTEL